MNLDYTPDQIAFQAEVRAFLADELPARISARVRRGAVLDKDNMEEWHAILAARGWLAGHWPKEHGGVGWSPVERHIFEEECARASAPRIVPFGVNMLGPVLIEYGSQAQKDHYLPRILDGSDWWCQGYSEPGAGSDLASLKTKAERDGDEYIVNGQKTWTTLGQHANMIFCLVRTGLEGKPQEGISFLLIDLHTPGVEMRPIRLLEGGSEVNEVFFSDVRVPVANRVGEENMGWTYAKFLLTHERTGIAGVGISMQALEQLKTLARSQTRRGRPLADDPLFAARIGEIEIDLEAMRITNLRMITKAEAGGTPGVESSILKIKGTEIRQAINDLTRRALGPYAAPFPSEDMEGSNLPDFMPEDMDRAAGAYFNNRKQSIFGGSNEIQKNIAAKQLLGS